MLCFVHHLYPFYFDTLLYPLSLMFNTSWYTVKPVSIKQSHVSKGTLFLSCLRKLLENTAFDYLFFLLSIYTWCWWFYDIQSSLPMRSPLLSSHMYYKAALFLSCLRQLHIFWTAFKRSSVLKDHVFFISKVTS